MEPSVERAGFGQNQPYPTILPARFRQWCAGRHDRGGKRDDPIRRAAGIRLGAAALGVVHSPSWPYAFLPCNSYKARAGRRRPRPKAALGRGFPVQDDPNLREEIVFCCLCGRSQAQAANCGINVVT